MNITWSDLNTKLKGLLMAKGFPEKEATLITTVVANTIGMGIDTHGLPPLMGLLKGLGNNCDPLAKAVIESNAPAMASIDASQIAPQLAMSIAVEEAILRAKEYGVGTVGVHHAGWVGALGPYLLSVMEQGLIATITGQSSGCVDCAPLGGLDPLFSTNPIAFCYGNLEQGMLSDFSTAATSMGKTRQMIQAGHSAPDQWYRESDGTWTKDPSAMERKGSLAFTGGRYGGHRGYAMSLWTEAMAILSGGYAHDHDRPSKQNLMITVYQPPSSVAFQSEVKRLHQLIRSNRREQPDTPIRIPGERALKTLEQSQKVGVTLTEREAALWDQLFQMV